MKEKGRREERSYERKRKEREVVKEKGKREKF